ncbi:MAG: aminopeptidase P family protein [Paracoccaceae bacterium]
MFQSFEATADGAASASRLARLREAMAERGGAAFLVPRGDAHQGETVAPCDERLAWLTGFTGSAGLAIVARERAVLLVDGRYALQAAAQVDPGAVEVAASRDVSAADWLAAVLEGDETAGFDPWLHTPAEIERLEIRLGRPLVRLGDNPVDTVWDDRPPRPAGAVRVHPTTLAGESAADKRARLGAALAEEGVDAAVLTLPDSLSWLLNIRGSDVARSPAVQGFAILRADASAVLFTPPEKIDAAVRAHLGNAVRVEPPDAFAEALAATGAVTVRLDRRSAPVAVVEALAGGGTAISDGRDPCVVAKAAKNEAELAGIRAAHVRDGAALCRFLAGLAAVLAEGERLTEIDVARRIEAARVETGEVVDLAFDTIAGSGPNGAIVHYRVTRESDRTVAPGDLLLVDSGAHYADGTTDVTRTLATGPVDPEAARAFTLVLKGMVAISRARWPEGLAGRDLDPLARAALWREGLDYDHGTGHGVGAFLNVHEGPAALSRRSGDVALVPGMVLSNEPGCYREGAWGIRIENLVAVTPPSVPEGGERAMLGFETLTLAPIDRRLIVADLLDRPERDWLDAYHARVRETLEPLLDEAVVAWLREATAPLA